MPMRDSSRRSVTIRGLWDTLGVRSAEFARNVSGFSLDRSIDVSVFLQPSGRAGKFGLQIYPCEVSQPE